LWDEGERLLLALMMEGERDLRREALDAASGEVATLLRDIGRKVRCVGCASAGGQGGHTALHGCGLCQSLGLKGQCGLFLICVQSVVVALWTEIDVDRNWVELESL